MSKELAKLSQSFALTTLAEVTRDYVQEIVEQILILRATQAELWGCQVLDVEVVAKRDPRNSDAIFVTYTYQPIVATIIEQE